MFLDTSRGSFSVCLCVSVCVSLCLCTWSKWEPTPYALQMSSCLIINPAVHAHVNFIITDTHTHSEGRTRARMCICTHKSTYKRTCSPYSKLPQLKSSCIKGSCLSSHFISVIFSSLTLSRLCHFTHFFPRLFFAHSLVLLLLCFPPILFLTFASLCSTYLPGRFSAKEK